ncbi:MAG: hypothetical protein C0483_03385 [Pirellula sp.]|nr:hypothetical protein [Pirellula sp.]
MAKFCAWAVVWACLLTGCQTCKEVKRRLTWAEPNPRVTLPEIYGRLSAELSRPERRSSDEPRLTIAVEGMPITMFARWVADRAAVSVVIDDRLEGRTVTLDVADVAVSDVLGMVARRANSQVTRSGKLYFLGELRPEDRGVMVRKCTRLSQEEWNNAISVLLSEHGRCQPFTDGLVVVGDRVEVLQRISELIDQVEAAEAAAWVVQLYIVSLTADDVMSLGLDVLPALEVAATVASASNGALPSLTPTTQLKGGLDVVLQAARERSSVSIVGEPLFLLVDGETSHLGSGQRVPIPLRTVSNQGTVNTTAYQFVDTGFQLDVGIREVGFDRTKLTVNAAISSVVGYVDQAPILAKDDFKSASVISSGGVYLLGALDRTGNEKNVAKWLGIGGRDKQTKQLVQVWARSYRIAGPCPAHDGPEPGPTGGATLAQPSAPAQAEIVPLPPVDGTQEVGPVLLQ